jgi:hypothetical protein
MEAGGSSSVLLSTGAALRSKLSLETRLGCAPFWQTVDRSGLSIRSGHYIRCGLRQGQYWTILFSFAAYTSTRAAVIKVLIAGDCHSVLLCWVWNSIYCSAPGSNYIYHDSLFVCGWPNQWSRGHPHVCSMMYFCLLGNVSDITFLICNNSYIIMQGRLTFSRCVRKYIGAGLYYWEQSY